MGNTLTSNPIHAEGTGTLWDSSTSTPKSLRLVQWVDDNGDIIDDSTLVLTINGVALTAKLQLAADISNYGVVVWQIGPFNPGISVTSFIITTMATGHLHVWIT